MGIFTLKKYFFYKGDINNFYTIYTNIIKPLMINRKVCIEVCFWPCQNLYKLLYNLYTVWNVTFILHIFRDINRLRFSLSTRQTRKTITIIFFYSKKGEKLMIRVSSISNLRKIEDYQHQFDEVWAIVRSLSRPIPGVKQVAVPSPSVDLFHKYLAKKKCKGMGRKGFPWNVCSSVHSWNEGICRSHEQAYRAVRCR